MNDIDEIRIRYLKAPTFEEIDEFMKELGVNGSQFERFFSIPKSVIKNVKRGERNLPVKFWPIIYEKKIPKYELDHFNKVVVGNTQKQLRTKQRTPTQSVNEGHGRLNNIK